MPIHHAVLSLLSHGPSHGYELKGAFEAAVGPQWGPLNIGHLYQVLDRLSRDGLVTSARQAQRIKPDRVVYAISDAGRAELARWLDEPSPRSGGFRDDFFLKVTAAARSDSVAAVQGVLAKQRAHLLRELRNLDGLRRQAEDPVVALLLSAAGRHVQAGLAFVEDAEAALLADGGALVRRLSSAAGSSAAASSAAPDSAVADSAAPVGEARRSGIA